MHATISTIAAVSAWELPAKTACMEKSAHMQNKGYLFAMVMLRLSLWLSHLLIARS